MRSDIEKLITSRPSWQLLQDKTYQDMLTALDIANRERDHASAKILEEMLAQRKTAIFNGINPNMLEGQP